MVLKLHGLPMSACTGRVMVCLHEKGVAFELIHVNLMEGAHKQPAFTSKNPFGQIPVLEDGDIILFESRAITSYLAEKYKESGTDLLGLTNPKDAALVKVWIEVETQQFNPFAAVLFSQTVLAPLYGQPSDQAVIDSNMEKLGKVLDVYEAHLSKTKYLAGDFYSLADLHHLTLMHYLMKTPCASVFNERPHVKAWWEDISSRSAFQKIAPGLTFG